MDRTLEELLAVARPFENGLYWTEALSDKEIQIVTAYMMEIYGIG